MTNAFGFDALQEILQRRIDPLPDPRKPGPNTRYAIKDAALGAFGVFFTQSPSFLEYQHHLQQAQGHNNTCTLFDVAHIPCNNQIRNLLDPLSPSHLNGVYLEVFEGREHQSLLSTLRVLDHQLLVALNGTQYHSSQAIHCHNCLTRQTAKGQTRYYHRAPSLQ